MSGKKIIGEGSTENKVIRLADYVANLSESAAGSGGGILGRVIVLGHGGADAGGSGATGHHTGREYNIMYTSKGGIKDLSPSERQGVFVTSIDRPDGSKPKGEAFGLYLPPISEEQDELAKRYFDDRVGHRLEREEMRDVLKNMMVYEVEFNHTSESVLDGKKMIDYFNDASYYFSATNAQFRFYQDAREYPVSKQAPFFFSHYHQFRGQQNLMTLAITQLSSSVHRSNKFNDGEEIDNLGRLNISGVVYLPASPMDKKEIVILGPVGTSRCRAAVTDYKINRVVRMGDLSDFDDCSLLATGDFTHSQFA